MNRGTRGPPNVDPRSRAQQKYCSEARCRKATKAARQLRWLAQSELLLWAGASGALARLAPCPSGLLARAKKPAAGPPKPIQDLPDKQVIEALRKFHRPIYRYER